MREVNCRGRSWPHAWFEHGDWFNPPANVDKILSRISLTDDDRWRWLRAIAAWIDEVRRVRGYGGLRMVALTSLERD